MKLSVLSKLSVGCGIFVALLAIVVNVGLDIWFNGRLTFWGMGVIAVGLFVLLIVWWALRLVRGNSDLLDSGESAEATILSVRDTGMTVNHNNFRVALELRVHPPDGTTYETTTHAFVSRLNPHAYQPGMRVTVRYDPKNRKRVAVAGIASTGQDVADQVVQQWMANNQSSHISQTRQDSTARLKKVNQLYEQGLITKQEFESKKAEILRSM